MKKALVILLVGLSLAACNAAELEEQYVNQSEMYFTDITDEDIHEYPILEEYEQSNLEENRNLALEEPELSTDYTQYSIIVDGIEITADFYTAEGEAYPTHVSLWPITQALGATASWDRDTGFMFMDGLNGAILMQMGSNDFDVNGETISLSHPGVFNSAAILIIDGHRLIPNIRLARGEGWWEEQGETWEDSRIWWSIDGEEVTESEHDEMYDRLLGGWDERDLILSHEITEAAIHNVVFGFDD